MNILVAGGAGYIGSHVVKALIERGHQVVVIDNLSTGHEQAVPQGVPLVRASIGDAESVRKAVSEHQIDAAIHLAALSLVGESERNPYAYYQNNVVNGLAFLQALTETGVGRFLFSSTAATYGIPNETPITEDHPTQPINVYGETKLAFERILHGYHKAHGLSYTALRYFNACGAHPDGSIGEHHDPETHLIPNVLQVALGYQEQMTLFGTDYPTPDGTCIRDYVHVCDLADAHVRAVEALEQTGGAHVYNLGSGKGYSNREIIEACRRVTGHEIPVVEMERRPGDPAVLIASSEKITRELGWMRHYENLDDIIRTAYHWHAAHPQGYGGHTDSGSKE